MKQNPRAGSEKLVWIDMEMSGLDPQTCRILEIATVVTDLELEIVEVGPVIAVHQSEEVLEAMDEWNTEHHFASGLVERVRASEFDEPAAEEATLEFVKRHVEERQSPLCGNSIWQDRRFIAKDMPRLDAYLHYRNIDVSSIKELARRWYPELGPFAKKKTHAALDDIKESIDELRYYRGCVFRGPRSSA